MEVKKTSPRTAHTRANMSIIVSLIWILFALFQSVRTQTARFTSPTTSGTYFINQAVPVTINFGTSTQSVRTSMTCAGTTSNVVILSPSSVSTTLNPPTNYFGSCTVFGTFVGTSTNLTSVSIQVRPSLLITAPTTTSPLTKYAAGSSLTISWTYSPPAADGTNTTATVNCAATGAGSSSNSTTTSSSTLLILGTSLYGTNCTLSLTSNDPKYVLQSSVFLMVTQQLRMNSPGTFYPYSLATGYFQVYLTSTGSTLAFTVPVTMSLNQLNSTATVVTNSWSNYIIPSGFEGPVNMTAYPTDPVLIAPAAPNLIYLKYALTFIFIDPKSNPGTFSFQMDTDPYGTPSQSIRVDLMCGAVTATLAQTFSTVPVNQIFSTTLSSSIAAGSNCYLITQSNNVYYYQARSLNFNIGTPSIKILSPTSNSVSAAGTNLSVSWTTTNLIPGTTFNTSLVCSGFATISTLTTDLSALISVPVTYYGTSCTVTTSASGYAASQVTFIVTQTTSFESPKDGDVIVLKAPWFSFRVISNGGNGYPPGLLSLQCGDGPATSSFMSINWGSAYRVTSSQVGSCTFTVTWAQSFIVLPNPSSVKITLKYLLSYTTVPSPIYRGQSFTIRFNTQTPASPSPSVTLYFVCPTNVISATWTNVLANQANTLTLPGTVPVATCYFQTDDGATYAQVTSSNVTVQAPVITITSPTVNSKRTSGTSLSVIWTSTGSPSGTSFIAALDCTGFPTVTSSTTSLSTSIAIPLTYYGSSCTTTVSASGYTSSQVTITVTQTVSFSTPLNGNTINLISASIPVKLVTSGGNVNVTITSTLQCSGVTTSNDIAVNTNGLTVPVTSAQIGSCTLTLSNEPTYLVLPSPPYISITLKYTLVFYTVPTLIYRGQYFNIQINTQTAASTAPSVNMNMICAGILTASWFNVITNQANSLLLPSTVSVGTCYFQINSGATYSSASSSNFNVQAPTITVTSPTASSTIASGTSLSVAWTSTGSPSGTSFTATLNCTGFPTITSTTTDLSTAIDIPSTYYGTSCSVNVAASGYISSQVTFIITQLVSFSTPTNGDVIALTASSIPVKLITSGGNVNANVGTTFQCTSSPMTVYSSNIAVNTDALTLPVTASQFGSCTLNLTSAPDYLILPNPSSITFTLKYTLSFTTVPATIYRGQNFTVQIDTQTPADSPPSVTLNLICPTDVISGTWSNVLINQPNNLKSSSTAPLDSCYFQVDSDATYTQAVSSNVQVSKVPVTIALPNNQTQYSKSSDVPLQITTTVSPVSGTVHLVFTCTSMTRPYLITISINVAGSFSYPSAAYGACRLGISLDDPIFS